MNYLIVFFFVFFRRIVNLWLFFLFPRPKYCSLPVVKSPVVFNRPRGWHPSTETPRVFIQREKAVPATRQSLNPQMKPSSTITGRHPASYFTASGDLTTSSSACYETAFTSVEPRTRIIPQRCASILRRSRSSERCLDDNPRTRTENASHGVRNAEKSNLYRSLDQKWSISIPFILHLLYTG